MRSSKYLEKILTHPDYFDYAGPADYLTDQSRANPVILNSIKDTWFVEGKGGGELSSLAESLEFTPEQLSIDENAIPETLNTSQADRITRTAKEAFKRRMGVGERPLSR